MGSMLPYIASYMVPMGKKNVTENHGYKNYAILQEKKIMIDRWTCVAKTSKGEKTWNKCEEM